MAGKEEDKKPTERKKRGKYEDKTPIKGSFLEIIQAAVNDAEKKKNLRDQSLNMSTDEAEKLIKKRLDKVDKKKDAK